MESKKAFPSGCPGRKAFLTLALRFLFVEFLYDAPKLYGLKLEKGSRYKLEEVCD